MLIFDEPIVLNVKVYLSNLLLFDQNFMYRNVFLLVNQLYIYIDTPSFVGESNDHYKLIDHVQTNYSNTWEYLRTSGACCICNNFGHFCMASLFNFDFDIFNLLD